MCHAKITSFGLAVRVFGLLGPLWIERVLVTSIRVWHEAVLETAKVSLMDAT